MRVLLICSLFALTGCNSASELNLAKAEYVCRDSGGLHAFRWLDQNSAVCRNGQTYNIDNVIIRDSKYYPIQETPKESFRWGVNV